jgi:ubiquinone/menaquinone biosynthesis C-methylase UbiE
MALAWLDRLDRLMYAHPFEGASARRYATLERPAFGDLDDRLLDAMAPRLARARRLLDLGCGPCTFAARAAERFAKVDVLAIDPSSTFTHEVADGGRYRVVRAAGEALPIAAATIDVAALVSSIRHVHDRELVLRELRRVVRPGGAVVIVELDPSADARRIANHAHRLGSALLRRAFGPLVVRTAPRADAIARIAAAAGWTTRSLRDDPVQPVYVMELE